MSESQPQGHSGGCRPGGPAGSRGSGHRQRLRADCGRCFGLCCVVPALAASADFAIDKAAGQPCPHLGADPGMARGADPGMARGAGRGADFGCSIHDHLRPSGFRGCAVYDCFGAGQQVAQVTFGGQDWRQAPGSTAQMFQVFPVMRQLHELLWYLSEALTLDAARPEYGELRRAREQIERLTTASPEALAELDVQAHRAAVNPLLLRASELARASTRRPETSLRGAYLTGADLRGADLRTADFTGADLRGADLSGANLTGSLFLTQSQLEAATGDQATRLPSALTSPAHWASGLR